MCKSVQRPFKIMLFPAAFPLTWMNRVPAEFHSQLWGLLFLVLWAKEPSVSLGLLLKGNLCS